MPFLRPVELLEGRLRTLIKRAGLKRDQADTGAVTLIQRYGCAADSNVHLHCLMLDGVHQSGAGGPLFHDVRPSSEQLHDLLGRIITRIMTWLMLPKAI